MKKGIADIQGIIMALVVIGILLGVGFLVLEEFREQDALKDTAKTVSDETVTQTQLASNTYTLTCGGNPGKNDFVISSVKNGTLGPAVTSTNYHLDKDSGIFYNTTSSYSIDSWYVNYTCKHGETSYTGINETISSVNEIPAWLAIIVIIAVVGILLAIVFAVLPRAGGGEYTGSLASFTGGEAGTTAEI